MESRDTCCCCLSRPPHRDIKTPYSRLDTGNTEIYSDMLADCFGIHVVLGDHECGICKVCMRRLRDASNFKLQVQRIQDELHSRPDPELDFKDEEQEIKLEMSEDENLQDMLMLNEPSKSEGPDGMGDYDSFSSYKDAITLSQRESPVSSLCEVKLGQPYPVKCEEFSDDEALHQAPEETFSNRASLSTQADHSNFGVRKEKKRRNTSQVQSERENDMIYPLRSKNTFKGERPWGQNNYRDTNSIGPYTCEICQKVIATKRTMTCHMQNHLEPKFKYREDSIWDCNICEKIFSTKKTMKSHMLLKHSKRTLKCDICPKRFPCMWSLNAHKRTHNEQPMNYCCEICGRRFVNKFRLSSHIQAHSEKKKFTCDICKKSLSKKSTLKGHIYAHMGVKPYSCKCGKKYYCSSSYKKHELYQHRNQERKRPFLCEICDKLFVDNYHLKRHKLVHTGEKPYACETCGKQFATTSSLKVHILTHVKDRTYSCELCPKKYSTKEGLRQHKRVHTGKKNMKTKSKNKKE